MFSNFFYFSENFPPVELVKNKDICDEREFDAVFREHAKDLHDFLYYKFGAGYNPSDIVQEAFMKLWENCHKVLWEKVRSFLFTVANNRMLNELSKEKTAFKYTMEPRRDFSSESPQYIMEEKEYMDKLQKALEQLPEDQRTTFMLNRIEGKKHKEIAAMLGVSRKTVEKRIYAALRKLREEVGDL